MLTFLRLSYYDIHCIWPIHVLWYGEIVVGSESIKYDTGSSSLSIYIPYREEVQRVDENEKEVTPVIEAPLQKGEVNTNMPGRSSILTNKGEWRRQKYWMVCLILVSVPHDFTFLGSIQYLPLQFWFSDTIGSTSHKNTMTRSTGFSSISSQFSLMTKNPHGLWEIFEFAMLPMSINDGLETLNRCQEHKILIRYIEIISHHFPCSSFYG